MRIEPSSPGRRSRIARRLALPLGALALLAVAGRPADAASFGALDPLLALCLASQPATRPESLWSAWSLAPEVVLPLLLALAVYLRGLLALRAEAGRDQVRGWQVCCFLLGMAALAVAVVSPLCRLAATLATAHMVQHALLVIVAPPLLLLGAPGTVIAAAVPRRWTAALDPARRRIGAGLGWAAAPLPAAAAYGAAIWFWHIPLFYEASLRSEAVHLAGYASLVAAGLLFWHSQVATARSGSAGHLAAAGTSLFTAIHTGFLGALLTLSSRPWYPVFVDRTGLWGLTPLEDQQVAGLIMWVPMGLAYLAAASALFLHWLRLLERRTAAGSARPAMPVLVLLLAAVLLLPGCRDEAAEAAVAEVGGDPAVGAEQIDALGCGSCHIIPGIDRAEGLVGPPLNKMGRRIYIAGLLRNTPENMIAWITDPQAIVPGNAMPDMGISEDQARDIVAYLYTLR